MTKMKQLFQFFLLEPKLLDVAIAFQVCSNSALILAHFYRLLPMKVQAETSAKVCIQHKRDTFLLVPRSSAAAVQSKVVKITDLYHIQTLLNLRCWLYSVTNTYFSGKPSNAQGELQKVKHGFRGVWSRVHLQKTSSHKC